jgi:hypothetical protein
MAVIANPKIPTKTPKYKSSNWTEKEENGRAGVWSREEDEELVDECDPQISARGNRK